MDSNGLLHTDPAFSQAADTHGRGRTPQRARALAGSRTLGARIHDPRAPQIGDGP